MAKDKTLNRSKYIYWKTSESKKTSRSEVDLLGGNEKVKSDLMHSQSKSSSAIVAKTLKLNLVDEISI